MSKRDEKLKTYYEQCVAHRLSNHQHQIFVRNETIEGWKKLRLHEEFEEGSTRREIIRCLFVIFQRQNEDDLSVIEEMLAYEGKFEKTDFVKKCLEADPQFFTDKLAQFFVIDSVSRRMEFLKKQAITFELTCRGWEGLDLRSDIVYSQIVEVFSRNDEEVIFSFESNTLLNPKLVFSSTLKYADEHGITLPDGTQYHGLYQLLPSSGSLTWCTYNSEFFNLSTFLDFPLWCFGITSDDERSLSLEDLTHMPEFSRSRSRESVILDCTKQYIKPAPSISATTSSNGSQKSSKSISAATLSLSGELRPTPEDRLSHKSIISAATAAREAQLVTKCVPANFFEKFDELNLHGLMEDEDIPVAEDHPPPLEAAQESMAQLSLSDSKSLENTSSVPFHTRYTEFCLNFESSLLRKKRTIIKAREMLEWLVEIVFHLKEYQLAARIFPLAREKLDAEEIMMLMYFHEIKDEIGSLYFVFLMMRLRRWGSDSETV